jgi:hypothetical protein
MVLNPPDDTAITRQPLAKAIARPGVGGTIAPAECDRAAGRCRSTEWGYRVGWGCWFAGRVRRCQSCVDVDAASPLRQRGGRAGRVSLTKADGRVLSPLSPTRPLERGDGARNRSNGWRPSLPQAIGEQPFLRIGRATHRLGEARWDRAWSNGSRSVADQRASTRRDYRSLEMSIEFAGAVTETGSS